MPFVTDIARLRLAAQQLAGTAITTPGNMVRHFGAIQAQDAAMCKWAIGARLPLTEQEVQAAIDNAEVIRTHVLRPTWHLIAPEDTRWMLALSAPRIRGQYMGMARTLGLDDAFIKKYNKKIERLLRDHNYQTREEIMAHLQLPGSIPNDIRPSLVMIDAELSGIVCNGPMRGKQFTYALIEERIAPVNTITKQEALAALAERYFISHGPATLADLAWWGGLSLTDARNGLAAVKDRLTSFMADGVEYFLDERSMAHRHPDGDAVHFLPAFDEFLISYKDRTASIPLPLQAQAFTRNGIFKPIITVNGTVVGIWKRTIKKDTLHIEPQFFGKMGKAQQRAILAQAEGYAAFMGMKVSLPKI
ncbi:winged helix DNA-binding domain-containing protein [Nemorincola caseinilytica]|uniref:Winged helix DNA-binding domain-containing protein n=1 Tax=Nemorincola caseinilytica TaxID=2054315 RepID=A0ABP8N6Q6_9BACT